MQNGYWVSYSNRKGSKNYQDYYNDLIGYIGQIDWIVKDINRVKDAMDNNESYHEIMVYFSIDENGHAIPSLMIQLTEDGDIRNIKGSGYGYIIDNNLIKVLKDKIQNMEITEEIMLQLQDLDLLVAIERKIDNGEELTKEDISFIYEIEREINRIGYKYREEDPRITKIKQNRNVKRDMAKLFDCLEEQVGTCTEDLNRELSVYLGDIKNFTSFCTDYRFPRIVVGSIMSHMEYAVNVEFPHTIIGSLNLPRLETISNVVFPKKCNYIELVSLSDIKTPTVIPFDHVPIYFPINSVTNFVPPERISQEFLFRNYDSEQSYAIEEYAEANGIEIYSERSRK